MQTIAQRYLIKDKLGQGGMGVVYRATDRLTGQEVALKQVHIAPTQLEFSSKGSADVRLALAKEFRTLASLRHPYIVSVLDYGFSAEKLPYFTMQLLREPAPLHHTHLPIRDTLRLIIELLEALSYLHRRGIIHRDLKPTNILVEAGHVQVLDFGLALTLDEKSKGVAGTLFYIAPEIFLGKAPTPASDLYAVGVMLYELLVGKNPFATEKISDYVGAVLSKDPDLTPLASIHWEDTIGAPSYTAQSTGQALEAFPDVDTEIIGEPIVLPTPYSQALFRAHLPLRTLAAIVGNLLSKAPEHRYQDARLVIRDLNALMGEAHSAESIAIRDSYLQAAEFVGREAELLELSNALTAMMQGETYPHLWLVGGESGVGKSRLLNELRTHALVQGVSVLRGYNEANGGLSYQLWRDILPSLVLNIEISDLEASILKEIIPTIDELLERSTPDVPPLEGKERQQRLLLAIQAVLQRQTRPLLLILEDLQWAGDGMLPLKQMTHILDQLPVLIVGSYRHDERPNLPTELATAKVLLLERLSEEEITKLSESMLGKVGLQSDVLDLMTRETEGNVFFMVEVARALAEEAGTLNAIGQMSLPDSIFTGGMEGLLQRRLARIPVAYHPLLVLAAVAGRQIDLVLLQALANGIDLNAWLYASQEAAVFTVQDGVWQFAHDKLREAVLHNLADRTSLHRQIAEAIEQLYDPHAYADILMHHWQMAEDIEKEMHYLLLVIRKIMESSARYDQAKILAQRGLQLAPESSELLRWMGQCYQKTGHYAQAVEYYQQAIQHSQSPEEKIKALNSLAFSYGYQGMDVPAFEYAQQALELAQEHEDSPGISAAFSNLGEIMRRRRQEEEAIAYHLQALAIQREAQNSHSVAVILSNLGLVEHQQGKNVEARQHLEEALQIQRVIGDQHGIAITLGSLGLVARHQNAYEEARSYYEEGLTIRRAIGDPSGIAMTLNNLGTLSEAQGQIKEARIYLTEALQIKRNLGEERNLITTLLNLISMALDQGDSPVPMLHEVLSLAIRFDAQPFIVAALNRVAHWHFIEGRKTLAAEYIGVALNHPACVGGIREDAQEVIELVTSALPAETLNQAMERGKQIPITEALDQALKALEA